MANTLYAKGKEKFLTGLIDLTTGTIKAALVKSAYVANLATHEYLSSLGTNVLATQTLTGKSVTGGVFDANDVTWPSVAGGDTASFVVLYEDTGNSATSPLIAYYDTLSNFPVATNGSDIQVLWDNGAYKAFSL